MNKRGYMKRYASILLSIFMIMLLCSCEKPAENKLSSTQVMMDTVITVTVWGTDEETLNGAIELCKSSEQILSRTVAQSDVSNINSARPATVSADTAELLNLALEISEKSQGAFDITVLPLVELWDINNRTSPPDKGEVAEALNSVNYRNLKINGTTVTPNGTKIDLGGIAKGYIADKVCAYLKTKGVERAIINLGGNVCVLGQHTEKLYSVGIQKPFALHGESAAILKINNKTAVTSGIYERYFEYDGRIYHHIIDPKTGYPADNGIQSVTVVTENSAVADALSTACLILGVDGGMKLAKQYNAETVFILSSGEIKVSNGLDINRNGTTPTITYK